MYRTYSQSDILLTLKNDYFCTDETIYKNFGLEYKINKWNHKTDELERDWSVDTYEIADWDPETLCFDGKDFKALTTCLDRLKYVYACLHDDKTIDTIILNKLAQYGITKMEVPAKRYTTDYYLQNWMEKYNITLEDFIFNDKYIVLSDNPWKHKFYDLADEGFLDWDNIETVSVPTDEYESEECKDVK